MSQQSAQALVNEMMQSLNEFAGTPIEFWNLLTRNSCELLRGELATLYVEDNADKEIPWRIFSCFPLVAAEKLPSLTSVVTEDLLIQAKNTGVALGKAQGEKWPVAMVSFFLETEQRQLILVVHLNQQSLSTIEAGPILWRIHGTPQLYQFKRQLRTAQRNETRFNQTLNIIGRVLESEGFDQAALVMVNDLAESFGCEMVSVSWDQSNNLQLCAISHAEKIDRRSELVTLLEEAGQEALMQRREIIWPGDAKTVLRAHQCYAKLQYPGHLLTLPIILENKCYGSVTLERQRMGFSQSEQWALRLLLEMLVRPLIRLEQSGKPLWKRLFQETSASVPAWIKPVTGEGKKFISILAVLLGLMAFIPFPYTIEAGASVKTDAMALVGAPFDGYLESSNISLGIEVKKGEVMFTLATAELVLERVSILADIVQYSLDADKRRAANELSEMQIAEAQVLQARSRLKQIDYRLANAEVRAILNGVIVEGEPGKNLGGAIRRGDLVVKIAAIDDLHIVADVAERDLSDVSLKQGVRLSLLADPSETYQLGVERIIPSAEVKAGDNTFPVRMTMNNPPPSWWRPGMSGVVKIDVGYRPLIWIATHRLVDYFRLLLW